MGKDAEQTRKPRKRVAVKQLPLFVFEELPSPEACSYLINKKLDQGFVLLDCECIIHNEFWRNYRVTMVHEDILVRRELVGEWARNRGNHEFNQQFGSMIQVSRKDFHKFRKKTGGVLDV